MARLFGARSSYQQIDLYAESDGSLALTLDDVYQFTTEDEHIFHEVLVDAAMVHAPRTRSVLILGGGDGLAARNALRYPEVERVTLCELDEQVIHMARTVPEMRELTEGALEDRRVEVVIDDARAFIRRSATPYDLIVCDFPARTDPALAPLFASPFYRELRSWTHPETVVSIQVSLDPPAFWEVLSEVETAFDWSRPMLVEMGRSGAQEACWADFVVASPSVRQPVRPVAPGLRFLTDELVPRLAVTARGGLRMPTQAYGAGPDFGAEPTLST